MQKSKQNLNAQDKQHILMLAPFLILFIVFTVLPVIISIVLSFTYFNMLDAPQFRGFMNYIKLFLDDDIFMTAVKNTLVFALITGPVSYFACLLFAWLINEMPHRVRSVLTLLFYAPSMSGNIFIIWTFIFSGDMRGLLNSTLLSFGLIDEPINFFLDPRYMIPCLIIVQLWLSLGAGFLSFMAGLQGIDRQMYEAGAIDGVKNRWQELWYITLPSMGPQLMFGAVMQISSSFAVGGIVMQLAGFPSTDYAAETVVTMLMDYGSIRFEMGYASAIASILFLAMIFTNSLIRAVLARVSD